MTNAPPANPALGALDAFDLVKVVDVHDAGCTVQSLHDGSTASARWSEAIRRRGIVVRPGSLVLITRAADSLAAHSAYEVVWRGPTVARIVSIEGDRVTYDTGHTAGGRTTKTFRDARPEGERQPLQTSQEIVLFPMARDAEVVSVVDLATDGLPLHPERLRTDCLALFRDAVPGVHVAGRSAGAGTIGGEGQDDPRRLVAEGYDTMAERYAAWVSDGVVDDVRPRYVAQLLGRLPAGARVLELGCGGGGPTTRQLAARFALTGVDLSARQIELARASVPTAEFLRGDMTRLDFPPGSFDGVAAFYSFVHLPHGELPALLRKIGAWLRPNGLLVATLSPRPDPGTVERDWLGVPMYFSGYTPEETRRFLLDADLQIETLQEETILEDGSPTRFLWARAVRAAAGGSRAALEGAAEGVDD